MKLTTQLTVLILGTLLGMIALVLCLAVWADWSDGAIVGMVSAFGTLASGVIVAVRNQQKTAEVLDGQGEQLATIERQNSAQTQRLETVAKRVNGELDARLAANEQRTAALVLDELRRQGVIR